MVVYDDEHHVNDVFVDSKENGKQTSECYTANDTCNDTFGKKQQEMNSGDVIVGNVRMESPIKRRGAVDMFDEHELPTLVSS